MFNDPRPVTGYGETAGWAIPLQAQPKPTTLKRAPVLKTYSSASSVLSGMEQTLAPGLRPPTDLSANSSKSSLHVSIISATRPTVPNFRDFVKQTPPLDETKPLPPTPLRYRRNSYDASSAQTSRDASPYAPRRTSSIYSRTASQWIPDSPIWTSADFADEPVPAIPHELLLRPIAYSASTPQLVEKPPTPPLLEPRAYQPLIVTPSPSVSRATTPSPPPRSEARPSILLPTPLQSPEIRQEHLRTVSLEKVKAASYALGALPTPESRREHLRTVSLEKAKAASHAPGAKHFLPEELRAQTHVKTLSKSRSFEPIVKTAPIVRDTMAMFSQDVETPLWDDTLTLTLTDSQGRDRVVGSPRASVAPLPSFAFPEEPAIPEPGGSFAVGNNAPKFMVPLAKLDTMRQQSRNKVSQALGLDDLDELRGRPMQRAPRSLDYGHYLPGNSTKSTTSSVKEEEEDDAHFIAREYHALLSEQYRRGSPSSNVSSVGSDAKVVEHIRMAPQPLFFAKPFATQAGVQRDRYNTMTGSISPHRREQSDSSFSMRSGSPVYGSKHPPPPLTVRPEHRRRSTSGTIPISPPSEYFPMNPIAMAPIPQARMLPPHRRNSDDNRISAYFPVTTKGNDTLLFRRSNEKKQSLPKNPLTPISPNRTGRPAFSSDPMHERQPSQTISTNFHPRPSTDSRPSDISSISYDQTRPHEKEQTAKQALLSRFTKGAVKYADILTRPTGYEPRRKRSTTSESSEPSHRTLPNPFKSKPKTKKLPALHIPAAAAFTDASADSPHLYPSPPNADGAPRMSLGWSTSAKNAFDAATSPTFYSSTGQYEHGTLPSRPLDARPYGFSSFSPDSPPLPAQRAGLLTGLRDFGAARKEAKAAEKRREEIKKSIRVVGLEEQGMGSGWGRRSVEEEESRPGFVRKLSELTGGMI